MDLKIQIREKIKMNVKNVNEKDIKMDPENVNRRTILNGS